ncbi:MAG: hypothetical protein HY791_01390 [Deltaproteobacteria bacterium]|nr:hypothetical protein [Deltaproteobacteria bacterium]
MPSATPADSVVSLWRGPESTELLGASEPSDPAHRGAPIELRSDESLAAARRAATEDPKAESPWRMKAKDAWSVLSGGPTPSNGTVMGRTITRLEGLTTPRKIAIVSLPYVAAVALAWLYLGRDSESDVAQVPRTSAVYAHQADPNARVEAPPAESLASQAPAPAAAIPMPTKADDPPPPATAAVDPFREPRVLTMTSALFTRPSPKAKIAAVIPVGARIIVYPELPAPDGWKVARLPGKEIGFVPATHLQGAPDPRVDSKIAAKSNKAKRKRRDV